MKGIACCVRRPVRNLFLQPTKFAFTILTLKMMMARMLLGSVAFVLELLKTWQRREPVVGESLREKPWCDARSEDYRNEKRAKSDKISTR